MRLFVYGTLKKAGGLHSLLGSDAQLLGEATLPDLALADTGAPAAVDHPGGEIVGEVWEVPDAVGQRVSNVELSCSYEVREVETPFGSATMFMGASKRLVGNDGKRYRLFDPAADWKARYVQ